MSDEKGYLVIGLDVSRWQNYLNNWVGINWSIAKQKGIIFGAARATVGNYYTDPTFRANWEGMKENGIYRTAYHVVRPDKPADEQIYRLFNALDGERSDLPLVLDVEVVGAGDGPFPSAKVNEAVKQCANLIFKRDGRQPIIYTAGWYANNYMGSEADREYLANFKLWVAQYTTAKSPAPVFPWSRWLFWQFSADGNMRGAEFGADSDSIDINRYRGTLDDFLEEFDLEEQEPTPEPEPEPEPELTTDEMIAAIYRGARRQGWDLG